MGIGKRPQNPTGVIGCTEEVKDSTKPCIRNNTIIEFRPNIKYHGEFGFDWLRIDDVPLPRQVIDEPPYKYCIRGSYNSGYNETKAYNDLKTEYSKLEVNNHRPIPKNEYFVPWLNIFPKAASDKANDDYRNKTQAYTGTAQDLPIRPPYKAELRMIANVQGDKPEKVTLEFPSEYFTINDSASPLTVKNGDHFDPENPPINKSVPTNITILCIKEFTSDQYIDAYAYQYVYTQSERDGFADENKRLETEKADLENKNRELAAQQTSLEQEKNRAQEAKATVDQAIKDITKEINELNTQITKQLKHETDQEKIAEIKSILTEKITALTNRRDEQNKLLKEMEKILQDTIDKLNENLRKQRENNKKLIENNNKIEENTKKIEEQKKTLAGKLCVCANDKNVRKTVKMLCISVVTNIFQTTPLNPANNKTGEISPLERMNLYNTFYQALIYPDIIENIIFDRTNDPNFKNGAFINSMGMLAVNHLSISKIPMYLKEEFFKTNKTYKDDSYFTAFFLDIPAEDTILGEAEFSGSFSRKFRKNVAMYSPRKSTTFAHEGLHGFGLFHTHSDDNKPTIKDRNRKYVYYHARDKYDSATTNIMSYKNGNDGEDRYDTWHWQWKIMRDSI